MIDLKNLITIAPFPEDVKTQVISSMDTLSEEAKIELENLAWSALSEQLRDRIALETQTAFMEVAQGIKKPEDVDPDKIEENLFNELVSKMDGLDTEEQIEEVRGKLLSQTPQSN